jgi:hypothetical protein
MSWVEKTVKPKKIVFKPWSEKETEMFEKIEATRLPKEEVFLNFIYCRLILINRFSIVERNFPFSP